MPTTRVTKWKWFYFGLALLDFVAIGSSLSINHYIGSQYGKTVQVNEEWANRLRALEELQILASDVNAPGNNVFETRDFKKEQAQTKAALIKFNEKYEASLTNLKNSPEVKLLKDVILNHEMIAKRMKDMIAESNEIFLSFELKQTHKANREMAEMDRAYASLREAMISTNQSMRMIQTTILHDQKALGEKLQFFEFLFSIFIFLMIVGVLLYGRALSKFLESTLEDQKLLEEQTTALNAAAIVAITDLNGKIKYVNDKFIEISGYSKEDLIGQDHRLLNSGHHPKDFFKNMWSTISGGKIWHGEIKNKRRRRILGRLHADPNQKRTRQNLAVCCYSTRNHG